MKLSSEKPDSDCSHSPTAYNDKVTGVEAGGFETLGHGQLPPDPDAGLSAEEKARIVRLAIASHKSLRYMSDGLIRIENSSGNSTFASSPGSASSTSSPSSTAQTSATRNSMACKRACTSQVANTMPASLSSSSPTPWLSPSPMFYSNDFDPASSFLAS